MKTKQPAAAKAIERITPPPQYNAVEFAAQLRSIATAIGAGVTPQCRRLIGAMLNPPQALAGAYTTAVRSGEPLEKQHYLRAALELLGRLASGTTSIDADAARQLNAIAEGLAGGQPPATGKAITIVDAAEVMGLSNDTIRRRLKAAGYTLEKLNGRDAATMNQYRRAMLAPKDEPKFRLLERHYAAR